MRIVIIGETATGKDYLLKFLSNKYKLNKIITYTTRPIRKCERDGIDYHFISQSEFLDKINNNFFLEYKKYNTKNGIWYYGTPLSECKKNNSIIILDKDGWKVYNKSVKDSKTILLYADDIDKFYNSIKRLGDKINKNDIEETYRRLKHDKDKFNDLFDIVDICVKQTYDESVLDYVVSRLEGDGKNDTKKIQRTQQ